MEIDWDSLIKFSVIVACCVLGVAAVASAVYIFHYASAQTKPTGKDSKIHFILAWSLIISVVLFGSASVFYVVKFKTTRSESSQVVKALRAAAKRPLFNK